MKNQILDSLNTTSSTQTPPRIFVRTPGGSGNKLPSHKMVTSPSATFDTKGYKPLQTERTQIMQLQLQQLRRQNRFLRKKLDDLSSNFQVPQIKTKCLLLAEREELSKKLSGAPLSAQFFFQQINSLIGSMTQLFRLENNGEKSKRFMAQNQKERNKMAGTSCQILDKWNLHKNIERIILQNENKRFDRIVELFTQYYSARQQRQNMLTIRIDCMVAQINELTKELHNKYKEKMNKQEDLTQNLEFYAPVTKSVIISSQTKPISQSQPFTRKHTRNKSNIITPTNQNKAIEPIIKFFKRTNKLNADI